MTIPVEKEEESLRLKIDDADLGICSTCITVELCVGRKTWRGPVYFCEQFDDTVEAVPPKLRAVPTPEPRAEPQVTARGLCVNCDRRTDCQYPGMEEGIWHCEDYV